MLRYDRARSRSNRFGADRIPVFPSPEEAQDLEPRPEIHINLEVFGEFLDSRFVIRAETPRLISVSFNKSQLVIKVLSFLSY